MCQERHHFSAYDRGKVVLHLETDKNRITVTPIMGVSHLVISQIKKVTKSTNAKRKHTGGPNKNTSNEEDWIYPLKEKKEEISHLSDSFKPCNCYRYTSICLNLL